MQLFGTDTLLALLTFTTIFSVGGAFVLARALRRRPVEERLRSADDPRARRDPGSSLSWKNEDKLSPVATAAKAFSVGKPSESLKAQLAKAGFHHPSASAVFLGAKLLLMVLVFVGVAIAMLSLSAALPILFLVSASAGCVASFLPNIAVYLRREGRRKEIQGNLPDALDLLEICVSSGMGMDTAWNCVSDEVRNVSQTLGDEMALTNLEMHLGASRTVAMRHMVERTGVEDLGSLVAVLVQSERFGTSIAEALKTFASSLRQSRSLRAEEGAEKMAVKLLFPLVLFIFPVMLIVVAGPAVIRIADLINNN